MIIVEDEARLRRSIKEKIMVGDPDFKVVGEYENGEEALLEINLLKPHVVLTDIQMPHLDGLALISEVKTMYPDVLCAVLTGYHDYKYTREAIRLKIADYLLKPPTHQLVRDFLTAVKKQLIQNHSLMEIELAKHWAFPQNFEPRNSSELERMTLEFFYRAHYVFVYVWNPGEIYASSFKMTETILADSFIETEEQLVSVPSPDSTEQILLLGLFEFSPARREKLIRLLRGSATSVSLSYVIESLPKINQDLYPVLSKARRIARSINKFGTVTVHGLREDLPAASIPLMTNESVSQLLGYFKKRSQNEFLSHLDKLLKSTPFRIATRIQVIHTIQHLFHTLRQSENSFEQELDTKHQLLEELLLQSHDYQEVCEAVRDIFADFFAEDSECEPINNWVDQIEQYIRHHYRDIFSLQDLSEQFTFHPAYLSRNYKRLKSISPLDFAMQLKMEEAKKLMFENERLLFKDVAKHLGYEDPFYFSKLFKKWTGFTPTEYKNNVKKA